MWTRSSRKEIGFPSPSCPTKAEVGASSEQLSERDFVAPGSPRFINHSLLGYGTVEITVRIGFRLVALGHVLPEKPAAEPRSFHLCHVPHETKQ